MILLADDILASNQLSESAIKDNEAQRKDDVAQSVYLSFDIGGKKINHSESETTGQTNLQFWEAI